MSVFLRSLCAAILFCLFLVVSPLPSAYAVQTDFDFAKGATDPEGGYVFAGTSNSTTAAARETGVARYDSGSFAFNRDYDENNAATETVKSVTIQSDRRIIVVGETTTPSEWYAVRRMPDGTVDGSFGNASGRVHFPWGTTSNVRVSDVAIQADGKIVMVGFLSGGLSTDMAIARLNKDGSLDDGGANDTTPGDSFGTNGKLLYDVTAYATDSALAVAIQPDQKIVVAGRSGSKGALIRVNVNGTLDTSFGSSGKVITEFGTVSSTNTDDINDVVLARDGKIVVTGNTTTTAGGKDAFVARYNSNGILDSGVFPDSNILDSFGTGGIVYVDNGYSTNLANTANTVLIRKDGRIVVGGQSRSTRTDCYMGGCTTQNTDVANIFGLTSNGSPDPALINARYPINIAPIQYGITPIGKSETMGLYLNPIDDSLSAAIKGFEYNTTKNGYGMVAVIDGESTIYSPIYSWAEPVTDLNTTTYDDPGTLNLGEHVGADGDNGNNPQSGDPINATTGNVTATAQDVLLPAPGIPTQFVRFYNHQDRYNKSAIGNGWRLIYDASLIEYPDGNVRFFEPDGKREIYTLQITGLYQSLRGVHDKLVKETDGSFTLHRRGSEARWHFSAEGKLLDIKDRNDNELTFTYSSGRLAHVIDDAGHDTELQYDSNGMVWKLIVPGATSTTPRTIEYGYDSNKNLTSVTDAVGAVTTYTYDGSNRLTGIKKPETVGSPSSTQSFTYGAADRAISQSESGGVSKIDYVYSPTTRKTTLTDSKGNDSIYSHTKNGQVDNITDPYAKTLPATWNADGTKNKNTDQYGRDVQYTYDTSKRITKVKAPAPGAGLPQPETNWSYDSNGRVESITDDTGTVDIDYDGDGNVTQTTDQRGKETTFTVNSRGQLLTTTDPNNQVAGTPLVEYRYNTDGSVDEIEDIDGRITSFTYDYSGRVLTQTEPGGFTTDYEYYDNDLISKITLPAPNTGDPRPTIEYGYDVRENVTGVKDENDHWSNMEHDSHDRMVSQTDATGKETSYAYDTENNVTDVTDPAGVVTHYTYDKMRRVQTVTEGYGSPLALTYEYDYYDDSQVKRSRDPQLRTTEYFYDNLGQLTKVTDPDSNDTLYEYYSTGDLKQVTNPNGHWTKFEWFSTGQLKKKEVQSSTTGFPHTWTWTLDDNGNVKTMVDANGNTTTYYYDDDGQLTNTDYPVSTADIAYSYDASTGRMDSVSDGTGTTSFTYDRLGRMVRQDLPGSKIIEEVYDPAGQRVELKLPGGDNRYFTYDDAGRMLTASDASSGGNTATYNYDSAGRLEEVEQLPADLKRLYEYDSIGRLHKVENQDSSSAVLHKQILGYDASSNLERITDAAGDHYDFDYDVLDRLTNESYDGAAGGYSVGYTYDDSGNRLTANDGTSSTSYTYDPAERLTARATVGGPGAGSVAYGYDANGNLTSQADSVAGTTSFDWDASNMMTAVDSPGAANDRSYEYDYAGRKVSGVFGNASSSTALNVVSVFDGKDLVQRETITGSPVVSSTTEVLRGLGNEPLMQVDPGVGASGQMHYQLDFQGSVVGLNDNSGNGTAHYTYTAFGEPKVGTGSSAGAAMFRYLGNEQDPATKNSDFHARTYDAANGRFLSTDPIPGAATLPQSLNPYVYGGNNPFSNPDPYGLSWISDGWDASTQRYKDAYNKIGQSSNIGEAYNNTCAFVGTASPTLDCSTATFGYYLQSSESKNGTNPLILALYGVGEFGTGGKAKPALKAASSAITRQAGRIFSGKIPKGFFIDTDGVVRHYVAGSNKTKKIAVRGYDERGRVYSDGTRRDKFGFMRFEKVAHEKVVIKNGLTGDYYHDAGLANLAMGRKKTQTPKGMVWHHSEDGKTMLLVEKIKHDAHAHTGGAAILR